MGLPRDYLDGPAASLRAGGAREAGIANCLGEADKIKINKASVVIDQSDYF